ncbi:cytochrome c biogenesis protein CcdA [Anaeromyxobacter oryzae]|uniref:Cytochrome C biogenesis protein CcdA n=1 Tax=Anaeromyxobacter oryzae TaxID=2918170 RepID=A0ABM7WSG8_9BACT|nr:cytochrome c biogenesis protein CcdA [Anaeromyxobacter oryzae]BDG02373.1 cytochrome C biogenesis protein CcdA [Anaeromyxobacter oryzae]
MGALLETFGRAFGGTAWLAAVASLLWGAFSVFLSPCHLSSIPLVVAYMNGGTELPGTRRAAVLSGAFAAGNVVSIALVGLATLLAGRMAGDLGKVGSYALAAVFFALGLNLLGALPLPSWPARSGVRRRGAWGALALGAAFGTALGPCTFAFMAPLLGVAFSAGRDHPVLGSSLVALYAAGHAGAIVIAGVSAQSLHRCLSSRAGARATGLLRAAAAAAVLAGGLYFLFTAPA